MTLNPADDDNIEVIGGDLALGGAAGGDPEPADEGKSLTALFAQQMAARAQLEQMRQGALPPGAEGGRSPFHSGTGQYL
ncbi:MAG: DUF2587 domain-containing protein [Actinobacteria bacterium]|nr:DUF2587 domain-containing protein [Actinomycetota bacterium]